MTSVGKLLVVLQLILSISFVVFSGAVYTTHKTWRQKADAAEAKAAKAQSDMNAALNELNTKQAAADQKVAEAEGQVVQLQGQLQNAQAAVQAAEQKNNQLEQELQTSMSLASAKSREAQFRREQAVEQSARNNELHDKLESNAAAARATQDELFAKSLEAEQLTTRYEDAISELADMRTVLVANNISADIETIRAKDEPPPPIDGLIVDTARDKTGSVYMVEISIGSDDGIRAGHELSVVRPAELNQGRAKYLGVIKIVNVDNDSAVGRVIDNLGIIEKGDNVTSKL